MGQATVLRFWVLGVAASCVLVAPAVAPLRAAQNASLVFSTSLTGGQPVRMAVDAQGFIYLAGKVVGPSSAPSFVMKLAPAGSIVYTTYLKGTRFTAEPGDCLLDISAIAVDRNGAAYVTGCTTAIDFPLANPLRSTLQGWRTSGFVTKVSASGTVIYSTYFGTGGKFESGTGIAADDDGNAYVVGVGNGQQLPVVNPAHHSGGGFAAKFSPSGSTLLYSTYLGASPRAVAIDRFGSAYITGSASTALPAVRPLQACHGGETDAFVIKLNPSGSSYDYATCLGGSRADDATGIAVDASGSAYVVGTTRSLDFPTVRSLELAPRNGPLWTTEDGGRTWNNLPLDSSNVYALLASPEEAAAWYAGTVEGAFKSSDRGAHWRQLRLPRGVGPNEPSVMRMTMDRSVDAVVYVSTSSGLFKSMDGGERWLEIGGTLPSHGAFLRGLEIDPADSRVVYAASQRGFWKSADAGITWTPSNHGLGTDPYVNSLLVHPATGALYADTLVLDRTGSVNRLFTSTDGGTSWLPTTLEIRQRSVTALVTSPRRLGRIPRRERTRVGERTTVESASIYVAAKQVFSGGPSGVLFRSDDAGQTWQVVGDGLPPSGPVAVAVDGMQPTRVYAAAGGVVFVSGDRGETFEPVSTVPAFEVIESLAVDPARPSTLMVGVAARADAFAARLRPGGAALEYSTYLSGAGDDRALGVFVDELGRATVFGGTDSTDFPTVAPIQQRAGRGDGFVSTVDSGGVLLLSTWVGGPGTESIVSAARARSGILIAGGTTDLAGMFPGSAASGPGAFVALLPQPRQP